MTTVTHSSQSTGDADRDARIKRAEEWIDALTDAQIEELLDDGEPLLFFIDREGDVTINGVAQYIHQPKP